MSDSRLKNITRNLCNGIINKILSILLPFFTRTMLIYKIGIEYVGLSSLFTSILGALSMAELGFGSAIVYSMYKPAAQNDYSTIGRYLCFYKKCYRIVGNIIAIIGLCLLPFLKYFIKGDCPDDINIYVLYFIYLINTVISYYLFAYRQSLFTAYQRNDMISKVNSLCVLLLNSVQMLSIVVMKSYYAFVIIIPIITCINNIIIYICSKKQYPQIVECGTIDEKETDIIKKNVKGLIFQKIGGIVLTTVDSVVISAFLGLKILGKYNNYYYIISSLLGIFILFINSLVPSIANGLIKERVETNYRKFKLIRMLYNWLVIFCSVTYFCLIQSFIEFWVGKENMLDLNIAFLFSLYLFLYKINDVCYMYREAAGLWNKFVIMPLIAALFNLCTNIILIKIIGLSGVIISTIIANVCVYIPCYSLIVFKYCFKSSNKMVEHLLMLLKDILIYILTLFSTYKLCTFVICDSLILAIIIKLFICIMVVSVLFIMLNYKSFEFKEIKKYLGIQR